MSKKQLSELINRYDEDPARREISVRFRDIFACARTESAKPSVADVKSSNLSFQTLGVTLQRFQNLLRGLKEATPTNVSDPSVRHEVHSDEIGAGGTLPSFQYSRRFDGEEETKRVKKVLGAAENLEYGFSVHLAEVYQPTPAVKEEVDADTPEVKDSLLGVESDRMNPIEQELLSYNKDLRLLKISEKDEELSIVSVNMLSRRIKNSSYYNVGDGTFQLVVSEVTPIYRSSVHAGEMQMGGLEYEVELKATGERVKGTYSLLRVIDWVLRTMYQTNVTYPFSVLENLVLLTNSWLGVSEGSSFAVKEGLAVDGNPSIALDAIYRDRILKQADFTQPGLSPSPFIHQKKDAPENLRDLQELGLLNEVAPTRANAYASGLSVDPEREGSILTLYYASYNPATSLKLLVVASGNLWLLSEDTARLILGRELADLREWEGTVFQCYEMSKEVRIKENGSTSAKHWLMIDDTLSNRGVNVMHMGHRDRLRLALKFAFGDLLSDVSTYLEITIKNYRPWTTYDEFYTVMDDLVRTVALLPYRTKGITIMPSNRPYYMSTVQRIDTLALKDRYLAKHPDRCVWVPPEQILLDLQLSFTMTGKVKSAHGLEKNGSLRDYTQLIRIAALPIDGPIEAKEGAIYSLKLERTREVLEKTGNSKWRITGLRDDKKEPNAAEYIDWVLEGDPITKGMLSGKDLGLVQAIALKERRRIYQKVGKMPAFVIGAKKADAVLWKKEMAKNPWERKYIFAIEPNTTIARELAHMSGFRLIESMKDLKAVSQDKVHQCIINISEDTQEIPTNEQLRKIRELVIKSQSAAVLLFHATERFCTSDSSARQFIKGVNTLAGPYGSIISVDIDGSIVREVFEPYFMRGPPLQSVQLFVSPHPFTIHKSVDWDKIFMTGTFSSDGVEIADGIDTNTPDSVGADGALGDAYVLNTGGFTQSNRDMYAQGVVQYRLVSEDYVRTRLKDFDKNLARVVRASADDIDALPIKFKLLARLYRTAEFTPFGIERSETNNRIDGGRENGEKIGHVRGSRVVEELACSWYQEKRRAGIYLNTPVMKIKTITTHTGSAKEAILLAGRCFDLWGGLSDDLREAYMALKSHNIRVFIFRRSGNSLTDVFGEIKTHGEPGRVIGLVESGEGAYDLLVMTDGLNAQAVFADNDRFILSSELLLAKRVANDVETQETANKLQFMLNIIQSENRKLLDGKDSDVLVRKKVAMFKHSLEARYA